MNNPNVKCLGFKVLVRQHRLTEKITDGGIIIPERTQEVIPIVKGDVIDVGPDVVGIKAGDVVLYQQGSGAAHELDGVNYRFLTQSTEEYGVVDCLAIEG